MSTIKYLLALTLCVLTLLSAEEPNWYTNLIFESRPFTFEFIRTLGYSVSGAADIGESIATAKRIQNNDIYSWTKEWTATAKRLEALAEKFEGVSAKEAYFRASNYYRTACFYLSASKDRAESIALWEKSVACFQKGASHIPYLSKIAIPYEGTTLPGYFLQANKPRAPLVIIHSGFDGTKEELFFDGGLAAWERGYNVILFEGPGQGEALRKQNLPFRYDWEKVVTPVVDYAMKLEGIDKKKISLWGISLGGYLAARAAAFEPRLAGCIVNGGIYDFAETIYKQYPKEVLELINTNPSEFNKIMEKQMAESVEVYWFVHNAMWTMHADSPAEAVKIISRYTLKDVIELIRCPMLVIDSESDIFFKGQPELVYEKLQSPKTLLKFSPETNAEAHCQMGAIMISNESILAWLDKNK